MKKIRNFLIVALVICTAVTFSEVAGTYAKYTSTAQLTDTARVAKWDIDVEGADMTASTNINLFDHTDANTLATGTDGKKLIAPGTKGSFAIDVQNKGEVTAEYTIAFTATNASNIAIEYSLDEQTWTTDITTLSVSDDLAIGSQASTETIYWRWSFERGENDSDKAANNTTDTTLGLAGTATVTVVATITATQVD